MLRKKLEQALGLRRPLPLRDELARRYLVGEGLEIGGLHAPLPLPPGATARYVDRLPTAQLREQYPELRDQILREVDIVCNGELLTPVRSHSVLFVIANHVLEHTHNPLRALSEWLRVVHQDGVVFLAVPDKRRCFDAERPITPLAHIVDEYERGGEQNYRAHVEEWVTFVEKLPEAERGARVEEIIANGTSIHCHAWTWTEFVELLMYARNELKLGFEVEVIQRNGIEIIAVLRKK
ncbi:MAG: methyltransferase domain-containing protein [Polyangiaceae bacterium]|nr:methyltransferase domain-containing protein [Polyangiaceae bacterium]